MDTETVLNEALPEVLRAIRETLDQHQLTHLIPSKLQFVQQMPVHAIDKPDRNHDEVKRDNDIDNHLDVHIAALENLVCRPLIDAQGHVIKDAHGKPIIECS